MGYIGHEGTWSWPSFFFFFFKLLFIVVSSSVVCNRLFAKTASCSAGHSIPMRMCCSTCQEGELCFFLPLKSELTFVTKVTLCYLKASRGLAVWVTRYGRKSKLSCWRKTTWVPRCPSLQPIPWLAWDWSILCSPSPGEPSWLVELFQTALTEFCPWHVYRPNKMVIILSYWLLVSLL